MQNDFTPEEGNREFTSDDRRKVIDVFARIEDEMCDAYSLWEMFAPYANIVHKVLTNEDIRRQITEEAVDLHSELERDTNDSDTPGE